MQNPYVYLDYRNHPMYSTHDYYAHLCQIWRAEILMLNFSKGTMRVRLYELNDDPEPVVKNHDTTVEYVMENSSITVDFK